MSRSSGETRGGCGPLIYGLTGALLFSWPIGEWADHTYGADRAEQLVEAAGYKNPVYEGTDHFLTELRGCGVDGEAEYKFDVTALDGQRVGIVVCRGLLENSSIRQGTYVQPNVSPAHVPGISH